MHLVFPYMSSINMRHSRHRATFLRHPAPLGSGWRTLSQWIDLFDLAGIVLPSGTTCQLSNMIDLPCTTPHPPPRPGGEGGRRGMDARPLKKVFNFFLQYIKKKKIKFKNKTKQKQPDNFSDAADISSLTEYRKFPYDHSFMMYKIVLILHSHRGTDFQKNKLHRLHALKQNRYRLFFHEDNF